MVSGSTSVLLIGGTISGTCGSYSVLSTDCTDDVTVTDYVNTDDSFYNSITVNLTCSSYSLSEEQENYFHKIEMRKYWNNPKVIGKPLQPQIKPLMGYARNKLHKHKLKPEICLN